MIIDFFLNCFLMNVSTLKALLANEGSIRNILQSSHAPARISGAKDLQSDPDDTTERIIASNEHIMKNGSNIYTQDIHTDMLHNKQWNNRRIIIIITIIIITAVGFAPLCSGTFSSKRRHDCIRTGRAGLPYRTPAADVPPVTRHRRRQQQQVK